MSEQAELTYEERMALRTKPLKISNVEIMSNMNELSDDNQLEIFNYFFFAGIPDPSYVLVYFTMNGKMDVLEAIDYNENIGEVTEFPTPKELQFMLDNNMAQNSPFRAVLTAEPKGMVLTNEFSLEDGTFHIYNIEKEKFETIVNKNEDREFVFIQICRYYIEK